MDNKTVVITGATKGLGKALALTFAREGYKVIGLYRADSDSAKIIESEFTAHGFRGIFIKKDISEADGWTEFDEKIKAFETGHFTLIANAAPPFIPKPLHLINWHEFSEQIDVNLKGTFLIFKRMLPLMAKARKGTFISVLSSALNDLPKGFGAYLSAKSALDGLTKAIAAEYAPRGIRAFSVSPGFMETSLTRNWSEHLKALIGSDKASQPEKTAEAIFSIAEDLNTIGQGENYLLDEVR